MYKTANVKFIIAISLFSIFFVLESAQATPMYYVFTGEVTSASYNPDVAPPNYCEYIANHPALLQEGAPVFFTALIDFARSPDVPWIHNVVDDYWGTHYFYAQHLLGSSPTANLYPTSINNNFGFGVNSPSGWMVGVKGSLFANAANGSDFGDSPLKIYSFDKIVSEWVVGETLFGEDYLGSLGSIDYELKLAGIASASAVPEPATMLFLGSGLIGLLGLRRKFRK